MRKSTKYRFLEHYDIKVFKKGMDHIISKGFSPMCDPYKITVSIDELMWLTSKEYMDLLMSEGEFISIYRMQFEKDNK